MAKHKFLKRLSKFLKIKSFLAKRQFQRSRKVSFYQREREGSWKYNSVLRERQYYLDKDFTLGYISNFGSVDEPTLFTKNKGGVHSYLLMVLSRFPRKYVYHYVALGRDTLRRYYTMPFRLSMSRFASHLSLKGYYQGIYSGKLHRKSLFVPSWAKSLESRLDSSLLRFLHYKSLYTYKTRENVLRNARYKVKNPYATYTGPQARQLISHGHVRVNSRIIKFGNMKLGTSLLGFVSPRFSPSPIGSLLSFTKTYYLIYRNMHLIERLVSSEGRIYNVVGPEGIDKLSSIAIRKSLELPLYNPLRTLIQISSWSSTKPNILAGLSRGHNSKESKLERRLQLQRLLRWKRLESTSLPREIPDLIQKIAYQDPSLMYARSSRCYASIVYGTRRCKWVQLQQRGSKGSFYDRLYHKINFFETELEYFQLVHQYYYNRRQC